MRPMRTQHSRVTEGVPEGVTLVDLSGKGQKTGQGAALAEGTGQTEVARDEYLATGSEHRKLSMAGIGHVDHSARAIMGL